MMLSDKLVFVDLMLCYVFANINIFLLSYYISANVNLGGKE
jgi:hypothetical protein